MVKKAMARGATPGVDGWTRELLVPLVEDEEMLAQITLVIVDILSCDVSPSLARRLRACELCPLLSEEPPDVPGGPPREKMRPVAPESAWSKLASHCGMATLAPSTKAVMQPLQRGVWGNVEQTAVEIVRAAQQSGTLYMSDGSNAYNCLYRSRILRAVYGDERFRPLWGIVALQLGAPGDLLVYDDAGDVVTRLLSQRGVRQGMVLGPLLYALATYDALASTAALFPEVTVRGYLDDTAITGPYERVALAAGHLNGQMAQLGLSATKVFVATRIAASARTLRIGGRVVPHKGPGEAFRVLGAWATIDGATVAQQVEAAVKKQQCFFEKLRSSYLGPSTTLLLLKASGLPRANYLARAQRKEDVMAAAAWFDAQVEETLRCILAMNLDARAREIAAMAVRDGGLGLRRYVELAEFTHECVMETGAQRRKTAELWLYESM